MKTPRELLAEGNRELADQLYPQGGSVEELLLAPTDDEPQESAGSSPHVQVRGGDGVVELPAPPEDQLPDKPTSLRERQADRRRARAARAAVDAVDGAELTSFQRFLAVLGIIFGFFFLLTIPGWLGIRAWGRYKRGEPSSIRAYMWFGGIMGAILLASSAIGVVSEAVKSPTAPDVVAEPPVDIPSISPIPQPSDPLCDVRLVSSAVRDGARLHSEVVTAVNAWARSGTWRTRPEQLVRQVSGQALLLRISTVGVSDAWRTAMRAEGNMLGIDVEVLNAAIDEEGPARFIPLISRARTASHRAFRLIRELPRKPC